jgi:RNA polymerase sigma-70 factor (ECF subfamily)
LAAQQQRTVEALFARYAPGVGGFVLARVGDAELAEEITARVFLTVVRKLHQCRGAYAAWLWSIVRSELAGYFRRRRPAEPLGEEPTDPADGPDARAQRAESRSEMWGALGRLTEEQQKLIHMKFFQDMRNVDIAEATGLSRSNVGVLIHRALKRLRSLMAPKAGAREADR